MKLTKKQEAEIQGMHDNTDKIKAENRKLKAAVEKNTLELESKNHELEIETALEKVRAIALSMKEPADMPDVCRVIAKGLKKLGVEEIRNVQTAIFYEDAGTYMNYEYYAKHDKTFITQTSYTNHKIHRAFANQMLKGKEGFIKTHIPKAKLPGWIAYQKTTNVFIDSNLKKASSLTYYWYSLGPVALGISTYKPLNEEDIELFKRFRNVFELAYRRFLDIELAITQAKEARIETALERVRAVAMAMRKPEELSGIGEKLFTELKALEFTYLRNTEILINNDANETVTSYYYSDYGITGNIEIDYKLNPTVQGWINDLKKADDAFAEVIIPENKMKAWRKYRKGIGYLPDPKLNKAKTVCYYSYSIGLGALSISSFKPVSADQIKILERFRNVFNLSYQRYIDISKAEEQAREAQIELALERVRARAMAMQHSSDLTDTSLLLFQQVKALGVPQFGSGFNIWDDDKKTFTAWMGGGAGQYNPLPPFKISASEDIFILIGEAAQRGESFLVVEQAGEELVTHYRYMNSIPLWKKIMEGITLPTSQVLHCAFFSQGFLLFVSPEPIPEAHDIFKRFAKVFEQTYTRFLDLQKAEAQAREAQIEAVLEKVRSRSLAMQKSEELKEVILVVIEQFVHLNINVEHTGFIIDYKERDDMHIWLADQHAVPAQLTIPYFDSPHWNSFNEAKQKGSAFFANHLSFEEKNKFYGELFKLFPALPEETKEYYFNCPGLAVSTVLLDNAGLYIENFDGIPYTDEQNRILMRFGKVFQQTYTRFLDLQKAEAQVREAKIEAALERTRTQSMLMQHSKELDDTLRVFHEQVLLLGIRSAFSFLWLPDEEKGRHIFWAAWAEQQEGIDVVKDYSTIFKSKAVNYPLDRNESATAQCLIDWKSNEPVYSYVIPPEGVENYFAAWKELIDGVEKLKPEYFASGLYYIEAFMKYGCFGVITAIDLTGDEKKILVRFTIEFERAYTRFLDLQKAEAQVRESQIQLSLERVRARTMAMHKSEELSEISSLLFQQVQELGVTAIQNSIGIVNEETAFVELSTTIHGSHLLHTLNVPIDDPYVMAKAVTAWKAKHNSLTLEFKGQELRDYNELRNSFLETKVSFPEDHWVVNISFFSKGWLSFSTDKNISSEIIAVLKRFAAVFEQTYTRFLDLQRAEEQAKESQIQLALERVRARTMAMHSSDELSEASHLLERQVAALGIKTWGCAFHIFRKDDSLEWFSNKDGVAPTFIIPRTYVWLRYYEACKRGEVLHIEEHAGESCNELYEYMAAMPIVGEALQNKKAAGMSFPTHQVDHVASFKYGYLLYITFEQVPEAHEIFIRFANVFEQTYTRFLDLQKSEAQAREATIEASLERVRSKAMAMHSSEDLSATIAVFYHELNALHITPRRCGVGLIDKETRLCELSTMSTTEQGNSIEIVGKLKLTDHPVLEGIYNNWLTHTEYHPVLKGNEIKQYYQLVKPQIAFPDYEHDAILYGYFFYFNEGDVYAWTDTEMKEEELNIYKRFTSVLSLTYKRYKDLQHSEE